jgi:hypothetical protein
MCVFANDDPDNDCIVRMGPAGKNIGRQDFGSYPRSHWHRNLFLCGLAGAHRSPNFRHRRARVIILCVYYSATESLCGIPALGGNPCLEKTLSSHMFAMGLRLRGDDAVG